MDQFVVFKQSRNTFLNREQNTFAPNFGWPRSIRAYDAILSYSRADLSSIHTDYGKFPIERMNERKSIRNDSQSTQSPKFFHFLDARECVYQ